MISENNNQSKILKFIFRAMFILSCVFLAGAIYQCNMQVIGMSAEHMAPIAPILSVGIFIVLMLVTAENMNLKGKIILASVTTILTGSAFIKLLLN